MARSLSLIAALTTLVHAGNILWDGRFNDLTTSADLQKWSWASQTGPYQYYIHGASPVSSYVALSPQYKNPADAGSKQGVKITIDSTAKWNSNMWRTELIPQTKAGINKGRVAYHFSMKRKDVGRPSARHEHQINFFESHFTEMKYGSIGGNGAEDDNLQWMVNGRSQWKVKWAPEVWHNIAYEIDFSAGSVSFWHSTGSDPLKLTAGPVKTSTSSNGADWHLGVLRLPRDGAGTSAEDFYFSGVYVESSPVTTSVKG